MRAERYIEYNYESFAKAEVGRLSEKELLIIMEIGYEQIGSASSFVDYIYESYGLSKSTVWYNLKKLKKKNLVSFAEKGEEQKPLELSKLGIYVMRSIAYKAAARSSYEVALTGF